MKRNSSFQRLATLAMLLALIAGNATTCHAQEAGIEPNLKFGKPTQAELTMTTYSPDPDAAAVVLCRLTDIHQEVLTQSFQLVYEVKTRIKVLKPEGKDEANIVIPYAVGSNNNERSERISGLKATAYNMVNGKLEKTKMSDSEVFQERVNKRTMRCKFTIPQVKEGTVIEYEYKLYSDFYEYVNDWNAQLSIPVLYTKCTFTSMNSFKFNISQQGAHQLNGKQEDEQLRLMTRNGQVTAAATKYEFVGQNLPALRPESHVWNMADYRDKVIFSLRAIEFPGINYHSVSDSWNDIFTYLIKDDEFGELMHKSNPLKAEMQEAKIYDIKDTREKAEAIVKLLRKKVRWNDSYAVGGNSSPQKVLEKGTGNSAEINFILVEMLRDAGIEACPAVMSTCDHGRLPTAPDVTAFNATIVAIPINGSYVYYDASATNGYFNVMPTKLYSPNVAIINDTVVASNTQAFMAKEKQPVFKWVDLRDKATGSETQLLNIAIAPDGTLSGTRTTKLTGIPTQARRDTYKAAKDSAAYVNDLASGANITVEEYQLDGLNDFSPTASEVLKFNKKAEVNGDMIYLNPLIFAPVAESPFKAATRDVPIEFTNTTNLRQVVNITLPEGYVVEEAPKGAHITVDDDMSCHIVTRHSGNKVNAQLTYVIKKMFYPVEEYSQVKNFFDAVAERCNDMLVIKKAAAQQP